METVNPTYTHNALHIISDHELPQFQEKVWAFIEKMKAEGREPQVHMSVSVVPVAAGPNGSMGMMSIASAIIDYYCTEEEHKQWVFGNKLGIVKP